MKSILSTIALVLTSLCFGQIMQVGTSTGLSNKTVSGGNFSSTISTGGVIGSEQLSGGNFSLSNGLLSALEVSSGNEPPEEVEYEFVISGGSTRGGNEIVKQDRASGQGDYTRTIDYDSDGDLDVLQAGGTNARELKVFINDGFGKFDVEILYEYSNSIDFEIGDLDNDGDEDILVYGGNTGFQIHENLSGSFSDPISVLSSFNTTRLADIVDVDNDGLNDIVVAVFNPDDIVWLKNNSAFLFDSPKVLIPQAYHESRRINYFEILDIDNDDDLDAFVITDGISNTNSVYMTINNTTDTIATNITSSAYNTDYSFGDLNGDSFVDIAVSDVTIVGTTRGAVRVLINNQSNAFVSTTLKSYDLVNGFLPLICSSAELIDYDQDNDLDLIIGETRQLTQGSAILYINDGSGGFTENPNSMIGNRMRYTQLGTGIYTSQVQKGGDYTGDGLNDVLISSNDDQDLILHSAEQDGSFSANYLNYHMKSLTRIQYLDVNGDGSKDMVSVDQSQNGKMVVNYNDGNQNFPTEEQVVFDNVANAAKDVLLGDWNNNSDIDLFFANSKYVYLVNDFLNPNSRDTTLVYTSDPDGTNGFIGVSNNGFNALQLIDIDADQDMDLFIVDNISNENKISWLENTGSGFTLHQFTINLDSYELIELNGDNHPDLIYTKSVSGFERYVRIAFFDPISKGWIFQSEENTGNVTPTNFAMADVDVDGDKDVIFRGRWMENLGNGTFAENLSYAGAIGSTGKITVADLNKDDKDDLVSIVADGQDVAYIDIFLNEGSNNFTKIDLGSDLNIQVNGHNNMPLLIEDVDGDGRQDIASSFSTSDGAYVPLWFKTCFNSSSSITESACGEYTAPSGAVFTETGIFEDIIPNSIGCDSLITIDLTILPIFEETAEATFCAGDTYEFGSQTLTAAGDYTELFQSAAGCDSTVVLTLTELPVYNETESANICEGDEYVFGSQTLTETGEFTEIFQSSIGCDSTVVLTLMVDPIFNENTTITICDGDSYEFGSQTLTTAGDFTELFQSTTGCDSTVNLSLIVNPIFSVDTTVTLASDETYLFDGNELNSAGTYNASLQSIVGCDSLVNLTLAINSPPVFVDQAYSINENSAELTVIGTVEASDADNNTLTYAILSGNDLGGFSLSETGELSVADASALDFETTPTFILEVEVSDGIESTTASITVNLIDVDENTAPTIADQTFSIDENSANGTTVGTVVASDAEGDELTYSITDGNASSTFSIDANTGLLTVANSANLDFESTPTFSLTVQVADASLDDAAVIIINLNNVDENTAPTIADQTFSIDENSANGTTVGTVVASDAEGDALTYSITEGNTSSTFSIDENTGVLTVASTTNLDFESTPTFSLIVQVADSEFDDTALITVNLNDVDENTAPSIADQTFSIDENSANETTVGAVVASDAEGDALTYSITEGNTDNTFSVEANTGVLTVANSASLDFETTPTFNLTVQVADASLSASAIITINLSDVDESVLGLKDSDLVLYPNPVQDQLFIQLPEGINEAEVTIFDLIGQEVVPAAPVQKSYDLSELIEGIYMIHIKSSDFEKTVRIIKQ